MKTKDVREYVSTYSTISETFFRPKGNLFDVYTVEAKEGARYKQLLKEGKGRQDRTLIFRYLLFHKEDEAGL